MKVLLAVVTVLSLWQLASCRIGRRDKSTHTVKNPKSVTVTEHVYFDVKIMNYYKANEHLDGRIVVAVFGDVLPMTGLNFISLARGYRRGKEFLSYNNTRIHRIVPDFIIQMGDIQNKKGAGGMSIYGDTFRDEAFSISHSSSGIVSMANEGEDTNNSQFFITLQPARYLDGHHVAFGKVISGMDFVQKISTLKTIKIGDIPVLDVVIVACGTEGLYNKYQITDQQLSVNSEEFRPEDFFLEQPDEE